MRALQRAFAGEIAKPSAVYRVLDSDRLSMASNKASMRSRNNCDAEETGGRGLGSPAFRGFRRDASSWQWSGRAGLLRTRDKPGSRRCSDADGGVPPTRSVGASPCLRPRGLSRGRRRTAGIDSRAGQALCPLGSCSHQFYRLSTRIREHGPKPEPTCVCRLATIR